MVASIQVDLDDAVLAQFREDLLRRLQESGCHGVILDVSGLDTLDAEEFAALRHVITMTRIMGARSVLAGLRPGVVSALIESGIDTDGLTTAVDLDAAFGLLLDASPAAAEDDTDADDPDERDDESASASDSLSDAEAGR